MQIPAQDERAETIFGQALPPCIEGAASPAIELLRLGTRADDLVVSSSSTNGFPQLLPLFADPRNQRTIDSTHNEHDKSASKPGVALRQDVTNKAAGIRIFAQVAPECHIPP